MTNPFAPSVPQQTAPAAPTAPANPFAQPPAAPAPSSPIYVQPAAPGYPAQAPQAAPDLPTTFGSVTPAPAGDAKGPLLPHLFGCLVLVFPLALEEVPKNPKFITEADRASGRLMQQRMTATFVVLSDANRSPTGAISFGGKPWEMPPTPNTEVGALPYVRKGLWVNASHIIRQLQQFLPKPGGTPGMALGRVHKAGPAQNDPWQLLTPEPADEELARFYLGAVASGQFPNPLA